MKFYILDGNGDPVAVDLMTFALWFEANDDARVVKKSDIGSVTVSTVFLGLNLGVGPPILWETMVFGGELDGEQERYTSKEDALVGHERMMARVSARINAKPNS